MDIKEYAKKVAELRKAQRDFFRNHGASALFLAKQLEKEVDKMTAEILYGAQSELDIGAGPRTLMKRRAKER